MLALARKYRPRNFASVAVQSHVSNTLKGAIARGRVAHGYLLCGPRGTGKTTLARVLAMALNCERRGEPALDGEPCGACTSCQRIWSGSASLDVVEIDAASNRGVDDARDLRERAMYAPSGDDRYKVYIVDEAHMLTREAWNALLKILEEPPPRVVFVFATTEPQKIAQAAAPVLSRVQRFDLKRIGAPEIRERLAQVLTEEGVTFEPDALGAIARAADGGLRDALSLTDQVLSLGDGAVTIERVREALGLVAEDEYVAMLDLIGERRAGDVFGAVGRLSDLGVDLGGFLSGLADALRAQLATELGGAMPDLSERMRQALEERRGRLASGDLLRMLHFVGELEPRFRKSGQQQLLLETLLVRCALLDRAVSLEEVLRGLGAAEGGAGVAGPPSGSAGPARGAVAHPPVQSPVAARAATVEPPRRVAPSPASDPTVAAVLDTLGDEAADEPQAPAASAPPPRATEAPAGGVPDLNRVIERWDEVASALRRENLALIASVLEHAEPLAVSSAGVLTIRLEDAASEQALASRRDAVVAALVATFGGAIVRLAVKVADAPAEPLGQRRITTEGVKAERLQVLRRRDPVLGAAVDTLDLELME